MSKPPRICSCSRVVAHDVLCECQRHGNRQRNARHDAVRPSARARGYDHEWRKARAEYLIIHPHCAMPGCNGHASVVDHIIPHRGDRNLFWSRINWQPLCAPCHNSIKQRQERSR